MRCPPLFSSPLPSSTFLLSRYPLQPCLQLPSDLNIKLISFPLSAFACVRAQCFRLSIVLPSWPLTILLLVLFPPRLLAFVASRFPFAAPCLLPHVSSCTPYYRLHPYVFHPLQVVDSLPPVL